ncbi:hypothetical protein M407DRAFT_35288, partial [Tulasnella calospora MUT 4182]
ILPALTLDGMIHCKIHKGSFDSQRFKIFIAHLLEQMNPYPASHSVVVMGNCSIHKDPAIVEMVEE